MSLDDIIQSLEQDAQAEIKKIKEEMVKREKELKSEHKARLKKARGEFLEKAEREAQKQAEMKLFFRQSELRQEILRRKRDLIDEVYNKALEKLGNISEAQYERLLEKLMRKLPASGVIIPARGKEAVTKKVAAKVSPNFKISDKPKEMAGGFIWQSDKMNIDNSWPELIGQLREQTETQVASKLFIN